jgi:hypothetical protein
MIEGEDAPGERPPYDVALDVFSWRSIWIPRSWRCWTTVGLLLDLAATSEADLPMVIPLVAEQHIFRPKCIGV